MRNVLVVTPFQHLFQDAAARSRIMALSDLLEIREPDQAVHADGPALFHCESSIVAKWSDEEQSQFREVARRVKLEAVSLHIKSRYQKNALVNGAFQGIGTAYTEEELLENAAVNSAFLRDQLGPETLVMVENNNHLCTDAYDLVTAPEFISTLMAQNQLDLLLDVAHARITAYNTGMNFMAYLDALRIEEHGVQIHLSRNGIRDGSAFDAHEPLHGDDWELFSDLLPRLPRLRFATVEYYRDADILADQLLRLRGILSAVDRA